MRDYYQNSLQHILDEITRIDLFLHLQVLKFRSQRHPADTSDQFQGLYISEQEVNELISGKTAQFGWFQQSDLENPEYETFFKAIQNTSKNISEKVKVSIEKGVRLNLVHLANLFGLSPLEIETLLICLAPNVDLKYEKLFAYLQNDITKKHPGVDLILNLICHSFEEKITARDYFSPYAPLLTFKLIEFIENGYDKNALLLSKHLKINDRIAGYLLSNSFIDSDLQAVTELYYSQQKLSTLILNENLKRRLSDFIEWYKKESDENRQNIIFSFYGPYGAGKREAAGAFCRKINLSLLIIDVEAIINLELPLKHTIELAYRESLLLPAALYFKNMDALFNRSEKSNYLKDQFLRILNQNSWLSFIGSRQSLEIQGQLTHHRFIEVEFPVPNYPEREQLWSLSLNSHHSISEEVDINALAGKFNITNGQIRDAVATASNRALWQSPENMQITMQDLYEGCRAQSNQKLRTLSQKIKPKYTWKDIVLPKDQMAQLREITNYVKYKHVVYGDWGFDRKLSLGKGLNILFSGPSGTGKTMAAEIMANELNLDLYKIDLSTVVSKYIGETEKNLSKIFKEAETSNAILFFDEADALFGKRSEVKDSHDRYANIEIGYLLQKMDEYIGVVILATNMKKNMDEAFVRRMHFTVEFPFPEENYRLRIWQNIFPVETPQGENIDFNFLARKFKISGGNIKNIALAAAFYGVDDGQVVNMEHLILATKREFQKMGKLCVKADFERYYDLVQRNV